MNRWDTDAGGGMFAVGVGGGLTGRGANLAIVDDAVADREQADSSAFREKVWRWWCEVLLTRLRPDAATILTHTRWHTDDLIGRVLNSAGAESWTVVNLPAIAEDDDPLGRAEGEALWPSAYPIDWLERRRADIGERAFAALYQQRPAPTEGALFKRAWLDGRYDRVPEGLKVVTAVDASFGKSVASDYSAIVTVGSDRKDFYVLHATRGRWEFNELCRQVERESREWNPSGAIVLEDAAAGQSALQELRRTTGLNVIPVKPEGSKLARAEAASPAFEAGRVFFPAKASRWCDELIEEVASFPAGKHDDQVDALVYAVQWLRPVRRSGGSVAGVVAHDGFAHDSSRREAQRAAREAARHSAAASRRRRHALSQPRGDFDPRYR